MTLSTFMAIAISSIIFNTSPLLAIWEPEMCWRNNDHSTLTEPSFIDLKKRVSESLKGGWCSQEKINLLMDTIMIEKPKVCVEIGAFTGSSVLPVAATLAHLHQGKVYAIDGWSNSVAVRNMLQNDPNKQWWSTVDMIAAQNTFENLMYFWKVTKYVLKLSLPSEAIVSYIEDIDFLHLDGDYSEAGALLDVELYVPKVKSGGYILLSNLYTMINGTQPKLKSFYALLETCEMVTEIENKNAILFRKL